jgi:protein-S-isoprenylcysteine O-methyltransferase Ste14
LPLLIARSGYEMRLGWQGFALGCACLALGEAFRIWAVGYAGTRTRTRSPDGKLKDLVTCGPYARVRNPIYVGNCFLAAGIVLVFGQWFLLPPFLLLAFLAYQPVVAWEEELLSHNFGEQYDRYRRAVRRWLPRLQRYPLASSHPFSWGQALFSERGTLGAMVSILLVSAVKMALLAGAPD